MNSIWVWVRRGTIVGLLAGLLAVVGLFAGWERLGYDAASYITARMVGRAHTPITIVLIDDASLTTLGRWPWSRETLARLVERINSYQPAILALDVIISEPAPGDAALAAALPGGRVVLPTYGENGRRVQTLPVLARRGALGHIEVKVDPDGVVRSVPRERGGYPPFGVVAAQLFSQRVYRLGSEEIWLDLRPDRGSRSLRLDALVDTVAAADILADRIPRELLADRLVFVGIGATGAADIDAHVTPLRPLGAVPGVYIHAGIAASILNGKPMSRPGPGWTMLLALAAGLTGGLITPISGVKRDGRARWTAPSAVALTLTVLYNLSVVAAHFRGVWLPWAAPTLALLGTVGWAEIEQRLASEWERQALRRLFSRYVPSEVLPDLLRHSGELGLAGVQRDVAVLFVDVRGFTALAEPLAPVQVMQVLNLYLEAMAAAVRQHGGMVDKYLGDGLMAVFGAPVPHSAAVQAAVYCALDMHVRVSRLVAPPCVRALPPIGVGVHTGEAVMGTVGGRERLEYTAMGDVVNVAARLEEMAPPGSVLVSGDVVDKLAGSPLQAMCNPLGVRQVRGKRQQLAVYEIRCVIDSADEVEPNLHDSM